MNFIAIIKPFSHSILETHLVLCGHDAVLLLRVLCVNVFCASSSMFKMATNFLGWNWS